jgi:hypothetical protein
MGATIEGHRGDLETHQRVTVQQPRDHHGQLAPVGWRSPGSNPRSSQAERTQWAVHTSWTLTKIIDIFQRWLCADDDKKYCRSVRRPHGIQLFKIF